MKLQRQKVAFGLSACYVYVEECRVSTASLSVCLIIGAL